MFLIRPTRFLLVFAALLSAVSFTILQSTPSPEETSSVPPKVKTVEAPDVSANFQNFFTLFTPFRTDRAAISPDGKLLAYNVRDGETLNVIIVETENPSVVKTLVIVATDATSTPRMSDLTEKISANITWMRWVTATRLVIETNTIITINNNDYAGVVMAVDADGQHPSVLVTAREISETNFDIKNLAPSIDPNAAPLLTPDQQGSATNSLNGNPFATSSSDPFSNTTDPFAETPFSTDNILNSGGSFAQVAQITNTPLSPHVFDLAPGEPGSLIIRTNTATRYYLYKLNAITGKIKLLDEHIPPPNTAPLLNRQGRPLLTIDNTFQTRFPFTFKYERNAGPLGRSKLDKIAKNDPPIFALAPENFFASRAFPIGFDENPDLLYYASNVGRDTYGIYSLDLKTGKNGSLKFENPNNDLVIPATNGYAENAPLIYDRYTRQLVALRIEGTRPTTRWINPSWQNLQTLLENNLKGCVVDIVDWDTSATYFIVLARNIVNSGAFYLFNRETNKLLEFAPRSAAIIENPEYTPVPFNFDIANPNDAPNGRITGTITIPRRARVNPLPVVVYCSTEPWFQPTTEYQAEIRAIADMGFAILQVNPRGTWGSGTRSRLTAIEQGFDNVQTQDIVAALDRLQQNFKINLKRVAIMGTKRGGYLALRAAQLQPLRFKCVVVINPTVDLVSWMSTERWTTGSTGPALTRGYYGTKERLSKSSLKDNVDAVKSPVLILAYPGAPGAPRTQDYLDAVQYKFALGRRDIPAEIYDLTDDYMAGTYKARSTAYSKIETWLNEYIYRYKVDMGTMQELGIVKPTAPKVEVLPPPAIDLKK